MVVHIRLLFRILSYWLIAVICCSAIYLFNGYPDTWDMVEHGMTQSQVHQICGEPDRSSWPEKGDFYESSHLWGKWIFLASPRKDKGVGHTRIWLVLGRDDKYYIRDDGSYWKAISQQLF